MATFYRVDPARSVGAHYFVLDAGPTLAAVQANVPITCGTGVPQPLGKPIVMQLTEDVACSEGGKLFTYIFKVG
jgi:hypothetical protein